MNKRIRKKQWPTHRKRIAKRVRRRGQRGGIRVSGFQAVSHDGTTLWATLPNPPSWIAYDFSGTDIHEVTVTSADGSVRVLTPEAPSCG